MAAGIKSTRILLPTAMLQRIDARLAVILLSFVLALGFLMIILSCALYANWLPLLVGAPPSLLTCKLVFNNGIWQP